MTADKKRVFMNIWKAKEVLGSVFFSVLNVRNSLSFLNSWMVRFKSHEVIQDGTDMSKTDIQNGQ